MSEVLVLVDHVDGTVRKPTLELLALAKKLGSPSAVFIGGSDQASDATDRLKKFGAMAAAMVLYVLISQIGLIVGNQIAAHAAASGPAIYNYTWLVLMLPFATRMQMTAMLSLGNTYTEASATSGASPFVTNIRIMLPLMRPTILSAVALMFILLTHEFAASLLVRASTTQVMGTLLFDMWQNGTYPLVAAMALLMTAVTTGGVAIAMLIGGRNVLSKL